MSNNAFKTVSPSNTLEILLIHRQDLKNVLKNSSGGGEIAKAFQDMVLRYKPGNCDLEEIVLPS